MQHTSSIHGRTVEGRIYRWLSDHEGEWFTTLQLAIACHTTSPATFVSGVRKQLIGHSIYLNERIEVERNGHHWQYRLVCERGMVAV